MKTKSRIPFILCFVLLPFKAKAVTYNFNFYNNDIEEKKEVVQTPPAVVTAPAALTTPPAPISSATTEMPKEEKNLISIGALYYVRKYTTRSQSPHIKYSTGMGFKIAAGEKGGLKIEGEAIREQSQLELTDQYTHMQKWNKIVSYGVGLNLKKEILAHNNLGFEFGIGGNYLNGSSSTKSGGQNINTINSSEIHSEKMANSMLANDEEGQKIKITQYGYHASVGLNLYLNMFSLGLSGKLGKISTNIPTKDEPSFYYKETRVQSTYTAAMAALSYYF